MIPKSYEIFPNLSNDLSMWAQSSAGANDMRRDVITRSTRETWRMSTIRASPNRRNLRYRLWIELIEEHHYSNLHWSEFPCMGYKISYVCGVYCASKHVVEDSKRSEFTAWDRQRAMFAFRYIDSFDSPQVLCAAFSLPAITFPDKTSQTWRWTAFSTTKLRAWSSRSYRDKQFWDD